MALTWNITFPNGVFSSTDTLFLNSKVKYVHVRETTNLLLIGHELNLKHWKPCNTRMTQRKTWPQNKRFFCLFHSSHFFWVWRVLFHATLYERVTPFGLCNGPMTFERLMRILLGGYCRFRLVNLKFNAQNYKSSQFEVKFMTTWNFIRSSQNWTCSVVIDTRNAKQIHSCICVDVAPVPIKFTGSQASKEFALGRVWQNHSLPIYQCSNPTFHGPHPWHWGEWLRIGSCATKNANGEAQVIVYFSRI